MAIISSGVTLCSNASATGSGFAWQGGKGMFTATATFGGGTVKMQMLIPDGNTPSTTWVDVKNPAGTALSLTVAGSITFELPACQIRVNIATATAVFANAIGMHQ